MPVARALQDAEPAELLIERLLETWSWSDEDDAPDEVRQPPVAPAFLPSPSRTLPRPLVFRTPPHDRKPAATRSAREQRTASRGRSFQEIEEAVQGAADRPGERGLRDAGSEDDAAAGFAARIVASGALEPSALWGGGPSAPAGFARFYASGDDPEDVPDPAAAPPHSSREASLAESRRAPVGDDDPAPRSIYL